MTRSADIYGDPCPGWWERDEEDRLKRELLQQAIVDLVDSGRVELRARAVTVRIANKMHYPTKGVLRAQRERELQKLEECARLAKECANDLEERVAAARSEVGDE